MSADPYLQPPDWMADFLAAILSARGRGIDAADAGWDFLRARGVIMHMEELPSPAASGYIHELPSERSRAVLVISAEKSSRT